jgi:hypothetical protein
MVDVFEWPRSLRVSWEKVKDVIDRDAERRRISKQIRPEDRAAVGQRLMEGVFPGTGDLREAREASELPGEAARLTEQLEGPIKNSTERPSPASI